MSSDNRQNVAVSTASEIEAQAAHWIERRDFGNWTLDNEAALEAWLGQSLSHRVAYDRLDLGWQCAGRLTVLRQAKPFRKEQAPGRNVGPFLRRLVIFATAASAAMAAILIGKLAFFGDRQVTYATSVGGREIIRMVDGSQIELNTDTAIRISDRLNRREVWLDRGEAYFQVVHDTAHPFIVNAGNRRITDLGTKFSVRRDGASLKVAVSEGGVRLESGDETSPPQTFVLTPGQVAFATTKGVSITKEDGAGLKDDLAWRSGVLIFHHTRLADAAEEFNRYNHRKIAITDPAVANLEIGGTFPTTDVEGFAEVSRYVLHLRVTKSREAIRITR